MRYLILILLALTVCCSSSKTTHTAKRFNELTKDEQVELFGQLSNELKGDYLVYSGLAIIQDTTGREFMDSTTFVELVLDKDNRFAIRTRFIENKIEKNTMTFHFQGGSSNKGIGKWTDLGRKLELQFQLGTVDSFFDKESNQDKIDIVDNYSVRFDKTVDELRIWKTSCKKVL